MGVPFDLKAGRIRAATGSSNQATANSTGATRSTDAHARYQDAVLAGNVFTAATLVAGVAPGTALGTTPPACLWNPPGSGKIAIVWKVAMGYVSGTLGAGTVVAATNPIPTSTNVSSQIPRPTTPVMRDARNHLTGAASAVCQYHEGSVLLFTPTILRPLWTIGAALATTAAFPASAEIELAGEFAVSEGGVFVMQGVAAAGTTPLVIFSITWEEIDRP